MCDDLANTTFIKNKSANRKGVNFTKNKQLNNFRFHLINKVQQHTDTHSRGLKRMQAPVVEMYYWWYYSTFQVPLVGRWSAGATGCLTNPVSPLKGSVCFFSFVSFLGGEFGFIWGTGSFRLRWRGAGGGRGRSYAGSSPSRMALRRTGGGNVNLRLEPSLHLGDEEGEWAAQREGGRWLAGRAGRRKQESRGGATGERGRSCQWQGGVRVRGGGQSVSGKVGGVERSKRELKRGK